MDIEVAAAKTKSLIYSRRGSEAFEVFENFPRKKSALLHVMILLDAVESGQKVVGEKANRWLGWSQCAAYNSGVVTLDEMKQINNEA